MGDQKYLPLIFPSLVTCLLTKTRGVQDFLEEDKEKKWIDIPVPPTFYDSFRVSKVGNFTTGVGKVTNFIFTQLPGAQGMKVNRQESRKCTKIIFMITYISSHPFRNNHIVNFELIYKAGSIYQE